MNNQSGRIRRKEKGFAQISNSVLRDRELSLKAKGLYALIESYLTIENWVLYKTFLIRQCMEGESAFNNAWNELKNRGYLVQYKLKNEVTGKWYYEYELLDEPIKKEDDNADEKLSPDASNPQGGKPHCGNPHVENIGDINNTDINNTYNNNTDNKKKREDKKKEEDESYTEDYSLLFSELTKDIDEEDSSYRENKVVPAAIVPEDSDIDKYVASLIKKDKEFKGVDFTHGEPYMIFIESIVAAQIQDNVDIVSINQWRYFRKTLLNKLNSMSVITKLSVS